MSTITHSPILESQHITLYSGTPPLSVTTTSVPVGASYVYLLPERYVMISHGDWEDYEVMGVVAMPGDAPDIAALAAEFEAHLTPPDRRGRREKEFIDWLVSRGYGRRLAVTEWRAWAFTNPHSDPPFAEARLREREQDFFGQAGLEGDPGNPDDADIW